MNCVPATGPANARIMIVGEAPGREEEEQGLPFVGQSGKLLNAMLADVGIDRSQCFITNVCKYRPPNNEISEWFYTKSHANIIGAPSYLGRYPHSNIRSGLLGLEGEIKLVNPDLIIALGDTALWALTSQTGITKWRGSIMDSLPIHGKKYKVLPTYHPAAIMRNWPWRSVALHDLQKAKKEGTFPEIIRPDYRFIVRPTHGRVLEVLWMLTQRLASGPTILSLDLETRYSHIACLGIAWSKTEAICIPFMCTGDEEGYWGMADVEYDVVRRCIAVICHPNARIVGQNFLYDAQYISLYWGVLCNVLFDTMIAQHVCWPGLPKALDFLSSLYCEQHIYWKDEGKDWHPALPEEQLWVYNCTDAV